MPADFKRERLEAHEDRQAVYAAGGIIGAQVLKEFASIALRKTGMTHTEIRDILGTIRPVCPVQALTIATHDLGLAGYEHVDFTFTPA